MQPIITLLAFALTLPVFGQTVNTDTTFLFKDTVDGAAQYIFIDYNKNSDAYETISRFDFQTDDMESFRNSTAYLKENRLKLKKRKPIIECTNWVTLKQYKNQFYVYQPCEFYFISDSR